MAVNSPSSHPFAFLTSAREKAFHVAIESANNYLQSSHQLKAHVYEFVSPRGRSFITREWSIGHIMEALSDDEGASQRQICNMSGIEFDKKYFVRLVKVDSPETPPREPKTISRARNAACQMKLTFPGDETEVEATPPLQDLYPIVAGYVMNSLNLITGLYFIDQWGNEVKQYRPLGYSERGYTSQDEVQLPRTTFTLKSSLENRENEAK